jgi:hypothetical protein
MICYDCTPDSVSNEAVGVCNYCSAGICRKHAVDLEKPITVLHIVDKVVTLPIPARTLFPSRLLKSQYGLDELILANHSYGKR